MAFIRPSCLLLLFVATAILNVSVVHGRNPVSECWKTWSRCSGWSSWGTGILWKGCNECCKCKGFDGGDCVLTPSNCPLTDKAYSCHCSGSRNKPESCSCYGPN